MLCVLVSFCLVIWFWFSFPCFVLVHMRDRVCWGVANRILFDKFLFLCFNHLRQPLNFCCISFSFFSFYFVSADVDNGVERFN